MTGPDPLFILLVSTTGNELDDDLNALGPISFAFTSVTVVGTITKAVATISPFPSKQWIYGDTGGGGVETVFNVRIRIEVWDDCGKVYVRSVQVISETSFSGIDVVRWEATRSSGPGSTNCGSNITSGATITQSGFGYLDLVGTVTLDPP